jgi:glyoxylase-like metal-dependent hydrolase (beta-lactamase superfamily II)
MEIKQISESLFGLAESNLKTGLSHYSYFLQHAGGNVLFHPLKKTSELRKCEAFFTERGGIKLQLLTHDAEASASCDWIHQRFGAGLYFHSADTPHLVRKTSCPIAHAFSGSHQISDGFEAIALTGHTLGFTAYRLNTAQAVFLFIGDFLVPKNGVWTANVYKLLLPVGIANLAVVKNLEFDFLLPNESKGTERPPFRLASPEREAAIDNAIANLMRKPART